MMNVAEGKILFVCVRERERERERVVCSCVLLCYNVCVCVRADFRVAKRYFLDTTYIQSVNEMNFKLFCGWSPTTIV